MKMILTMAAATMLGLGASAPASASTALPVAPVASSFDAAAPFEMQRRDDRRDHRGKGKGHRRGHDDRRWRGNDRNWDPARSYNAGNYRERRLGREDRIYRGQDGRAYCERNDGTTGLVIGALGGGVLGNLVGGGTLGTLLGAGGGGLLGRSIERGEVRCR